MTAVFQNCDPNNMWREMYRMQKKQKVSNRYFKKKKKCNWLNYFEIQTILAQH